MGICGATYDPPYWYMGVSSANHPYFVINFGSGNITIEGPTVLSTSTWYNMILTCDRSGNATLYLNGSSEDTADISSGVAVALNNNNHFAIGAIGNLSGYTWNGNLDEVGIWRAKLLNSDERTTLSAGLISYPW
jgi:hypothetical protein